MFKKILIANRGEIAVRIIRACRELGVRSVAVCSEADRNALHAQMADEVILIGPAPVPQSYLAVERILRAAISTNSDAIHPGYGLLSENAGFARAVQQQNLVFIGPQPQAIHAMGDKGHARRQMEVAGVPVVPGYQGSDQDHQLLEQARRIGFPLMVKAAAGGGGKGMRIAEDEQSLPDAIGAARREAQHAFGDERLILERYVANAHHVEIQILGDHTGKIVHLFERECSVQRRHQKIIEETPSPLLDGELRRKMGAAAVMAARTVSYENAGTVEFIVDPKTKEFFFLEMNTRLQVEHPITELVTGLDLVQWQIRIAAGEALPYNQDQLVQRGHAIEVRLYAEDAERAFLPMSGRILQFIEPKGPGIRVDSGVMSGDEISVHYDPMLAKIIAYGENRVSAINKLQIALRQSVVLGMTTNLAFLREVVQHPDFVAGRVHTSWVEKTYENWQATPGSLPLEAALAAVILHNQQHNQTGRAVKHDSTHHYNPWQAGNDFRIGEAG